MSALNFTMCSMCVMCVMLVPAYLKEGPEGRVKGELGLAGFCQMGFKSRRLGFGHWEWEWDK